MTLALFLATQPPTDIWHDSAFQLGVNVITAIVAAIIGALVGGLIAIWIYRRQRSRKEISYQVILDASVISIDQSVVSDVEIKLKGNPVKEVTLALLKVSNTGNTAVKKDDYEEPLTFLFTKRKVISSKVVETEPKDLIANAIHTTFFPVPTPGQDFLEFPPFLLNGKESVTFSILLDGAKDAISKKGRIVDGTIVLLDLERRSQKLVTLSIFSATLITFGILGIALGILSILGININNSIFGIIFAIIFGIIFGFVGSFLSSIISNFITNKK